MRPAGANGEWQVARDEWLVCCSLYLSGVSVHGEERDGTRLLLLENKHICATFTVADDACRMVSLARSSLRALANRNEGRRNRE